jgi:hypothetical protein
MKFDELYNRCISDWPLVIDVRALERYDSSPLYSLPEDARNIMDTIEESRCLCNHSRSLYLYFYFSYCRYSFHKIDIAQSKRIEESRVSPHPLLHLRQPDGCDHARFACAQKFTPIQKDKRPTLSASDFKSLVSTGFAVDIAICFFYAF